MLRVALGILIAMAGAGSALAQSCGPSSDGCRVADGYYHARLPGQPAEGAPMVVFLHGAGGRGQATLNNSRLVEPLLARGYAVIAPTAGDRPGSRFRRVWTFYPGWEGRDDFAFLQAVVADAAERFGTSDRQVILAGFSAGAFLVSYVACATPGAYAAYAPVAGGFWRPHPDTCAGPVRLLQTHGWSDTTVPLEGRILGGGRFEQGDIFRGMEIWRRANGCQGMDPDSYDRPDPFMRRAWIDCAPGSALVFALFSGGHTVPAGWSDMMLDWFEALPDPVSD